MPNIIDANGLTVKTRAELLTEFTTAYQAIYGSDINLGSDTPDGQQINIYIQSVLDLLDLVVQIFNSFDPDLAVGITLDQRVAYNGIQRQAGTRTITNITLITDRALNLNGVDDNLFAPLPFYIVSDSAGNQWELIESQTIASAGTYVFAFRSQNIGAVLTVPNTITIPVTVVIGVTSINNPTTYTSLGLNTETDAQLRLRRQQSVSISSQGYHDALVALLRNINGITAAFVYENTDSTTDGDGIPGHSIWVIVAGEAENADIAQAIYIKRNAGCGMKGDIEETITQIDGTLFSVRWDEVEPEDIFIEFDATSINGVDAIDVDGIKDYLVENFHFGINETIDINEIATLVQAFDPNCLVTNAGLSKSGSGPFTNTLNPTAKNNQFALDGANIDITVV